MAQKKTGRPSKYSHQLAENICARLMSGESLKAICQDEDMPGQSTVYMWLTEKSEFLEMYARAREVQADVMAADILQIADDGSNDTYKDDDGNIRTDHDVVARSRLRVDARKWLAAKLAPKKYGDKLELAGDKNAPLTVEVIRLTDE